MFSFCIFTVTDTRLFALGFGVFVSFYIQRKILIVYIAQDLQLEAE